jgi:anti-sigma regulatory factor (Ser/Thr protein kinase)
LDHVAHVTDLHEVPALRDVFETHLGVRGLDGEVVQGWGLIFTELVNNAVEHGRRGAVDAVRIGWEIRDDDVALVVVEPGDCPLTEKDFDQADAADFAEEGRGAGLFLIRAFVDEIRVQPLVEGGTEIRIVRRIDPQQGANGADQ